MNLLSLKGFFSNCILLVTIASLLHTGAHARLWTSADGTMTIEGELTFYDPATGKVGVKLANGKVSKFEQNILSEADITFLKKRGKVVDITTGNPPEKAKAAALGFVPG
jgi:hypothetical protein